jgi:hypothetical protein
MSPDAGAGPAPREVRAWNQDEVERARAWRALTPPLTYLEIGRRLGGRSEQSVRLKLYDERTRALRGPVGKVGWSRAQREEKGPAAISNRDAACVEACRRTGGFTAFSHQQLRGAQWALCRPIIGADARPRPQGWRDGRDPAAMSGQDAAYLAALRRWWRERDREARARRAAQG